MSKITDDGLTRSGTGWMLYSCTRMTTVGVKGLKHPAAAAAADKLSCCRPACNFVPAEWAEKQLLNAANEDAVAMTTR